MPIEAFDVRPSHATPNLDLVFYIRADGKDMGVEALNSLLQEIYPIAPKNNADDIKRLYHYHRLEFRKATEHAYRTRTANFVFDTATLMPDDFRNISPDINERNVDRPH